MIARRTEARPLSRAGSRLMVGLLVIGSLGAAEMTSPTTSVGAAPPEAVWTLVAGDGSPYAAEDGPAATSPLGAVQDAVLTDDGAILILSASRVREVRDGQMRTIAGGGVGAPFDGAVATSVDLGSPEIASGPDGRAYIADNRSVYALGDDGRLAEVAHVADITPPGELPGLFHFDAIDVGSDGSLLTASSDGMVRRWDAAGGASVVARATAGAFSGMADVAAGPNGEVYVLGTTEPSEPRAVWRVDSGAPTRVLGARSTGQMPCPSATQIEVQGLREIAVDGRGRLNASSLGSVIRVRGDGGAQRLGLPGPNSAADLATFDVDRLGRTLAVVDGRAYLAPPVMDATMGCRGLPYPSPGSAVDALSFGLRVPATPVQRSALAERVRSGEIDMADAADEYLHRPEWEGVVGPLTRLYVTTLGRNPDTGGLQYWLAERRSGRSLVSVAAYLARSTEFRATYGTLDDAAFVDRLYRNVLGRAGEPAGRAYWEARLGSGMSRPDLVIGFAQSPELRSRMRATTEATLATLGLLGRVPTSKEFSVWRAHIDAPSPRHLVAGVWYSEEHRRRVEAHR